MKMFFSSAVLGCLVSLAVPSIAAAQDDNGSGSDTSMNCEQEAKNMGLTKPDEIAAYVKECEDAAAPADQQDDQEMDQQQDGQDPDQSGGGMD